VTQLKSMTLCVVAGSAVAVAGCGTPGSNHHPPQTNSETVLITYHVIHGKEQELAIALAKAWEIYQREQMVFPEPHIVAQDSDTKGKPRMVEIFTWVSSSTPDHAPESVKKLWNEMQACCDKQNGGEGLEGGAVELLVPKPR
jgi:hypothetical protein